MKKEDKKKRVLERQKNIEDKNDKRLGEIENQGEKQLDMIDK